MPFDGPEPADYRNVSSLNHAYLRLLQQDPAAGSNCLPAPLRRRLANLTRQQLARLAGTPFLLLSFRERDDELWEQIFAHDSACDLLAPHTAGDRERLVSAGLGFVWQLARRNPYTLRLICAASLHWCEQIGERTFFGLLAAAAPYTDLVEPRQGGDRRLWRILLYAGVSNNDKVRRAAQMSALQMLLTQPPLRAPRSWNIAARRTAVPGLRVADE